MRNTGTSIGPAFEHPAPDSFLGFNRRKIRECEIVLALVMAAFLHELLPPLIVDDPRDRVRKLAFNWVTGGSGTDQIRVDHPTTAQAQDSVEPGSECMHFSVGCRMHVRTTKGP